MIVKSFELTKKIPKNINFFLLYGSNLGLIEEIINKFLKPIFSKNLFIYDEIDLLKSPSQFYEEIFNKSFFDNDKLLIINRATDRILSIIETLVAKNLDDLKIVIKSDILEKKSKLRIFFEKNKDVIVTPFYEETHQQLASIAINFFKEKKIAISSKSLNLILEKVGSDRMSLNNEMQKIYYFYQTEKKVCFDDIKKLINLGKNYNVSELVDQCLIKNKSKVLKMINDNYFSSDDNIAIIKSFINKLKRLKIIQNKVSANSNFETATKFIYPPIFWKDKEIIKNQIKIWSLKEINKLIKKTNQIELSIKKNSQISNFLIFNFIIYTTHFTNN